MDALSSKMYISAENYPGEGESENSCALPSLVLVGATPPANEPGSIFASIIFISLLEAPDLAGLKYGIIASQRSIIGKAAFSPALNATISASQVE